MSSKPLENTTVLIVDDKMAMRTIVRTILQQLGVRNILEANDGEEAIMLLSKRNKSKNTSQNPSPKAAIDCIICDWNMPKMNGLQLLSNVRRDRDLKDLPFMMLTAETERSHIVSAMELGVSDYIIKPFTSFALAQKLRQVIQGIVD